ncbi:MAG: glutamate N-acetyltransferase / amino-acid N-acetyltransferase [Chthoniobacter sp.]|nr:glutamate N-acetyltransferase / amino-acid N-acetyltransferase [Chthoniobacter sp.]
MTASFIEICGGVTAPGGFVAGSAFCGIKATNQDKHDLALIYSPVPTVGAATFTTNKIKAAPVRVSMSHMRCGDIRAIIANSGNANACTGVPGIEHAKRMAHATAAALEIRDPQVLVCSTGRIGVELPIEKMEETIAQLPKALQKDGSLKAARAIMTSDTFAKEIAVELTLDGKCVRIGGIAKGAGMIDPNMATMLCFITTDAAIGRKDLQRALSNSVEQSFNRITIDGDMSTNDTVIALANGLAGNARLRRTHANFKQFQTALNYITGELARKIVEDGEGVTKFVEIAIKGAATFQDARKAAEAIANSTLVKCAWFGGDPNWGRIMDALGYSTARIREESVDIFYEGLAAVKSGTASATPFEELEKIVRQPKFTVTVNLHLGSAEYWVFTTDLSTRYVELNMGE